MAESKKTKVSGASVGIVRTPAARRDHGACARTRARARERARFGPCSSPRLALAPPPATQPDLRLLLFPPLASPLFPIAGPRHDLLVRRRVAARPRGDHRERPGQPHDALVRGLHGRGAPRGRRGQEPGGHEPDQHGLRRQAPHRPQVRGPHRAGGHEAVALQGHQGRGEQAHDRGGLQGRAQAVRRRGDLRHGAAEECVARALARALPALSPRAPSRAVPPARADARAALVPPRAAPPRPAGPQ